VVLRIIVAFDAIGAIVAFQAIVVFIIPFVSCPAEIIAQDVAYGILLEFHCTP
jgi:hypothetical protein